jgi:nucleoside-diphosphate-sugar epimerase
MAKESTEKMIYRIAEEQGSFEAMSIMPGYVIGPVMCVNHDQKESFQYWIKCMLMGQPYRKVTGGRMQWNKADVRDIARAHRLCTESTVAHNGSRYIIAAHDDAEILFTWELQKKMRELFPAIPEIGGEEMVDGKPAQPTRDSQRAYSTLAEKELGLKTYTLEETLRDTAESYVRIGLLPAFDR